jgi:hypothetical protein
VRFVFWALLCANALLFAYGRGLLGNAGDELREPARLRGQVAADRLVLLTAEQAQALAAAAVPAESGSGSAADTADTTADTAAESPPPPAAPRFPAVACVETDAFTAADARRFETRLARLDLGARQTRLTVPFQEVTSHLVYLPPQGGKEGAELLLHHAGRIAAALRNLARRVQDRSGGTHAGRDAGETGCAERTHPAARAAIAAFRLPLPRHRHRYPDAHRRGRARHAGGRAAYL